jgi:hypothetical protein
MNKLQQFVLKYINPKYYNALHVIIGLIVGTIIHFLIEAFPLTDPISKFGLLITKLIPTIAILWLGGVRWEQNQARNYGAKFSNLDVALGIFGGVLSVLILNFI